MKIQVTIQNAILTWNSPEEESVLLPILNPTLHQREAKCIQLPSSSAESLCSYLRSKKLNVVFEYSDVTAQAKATYWKHVLINGPAKVDRTRFDAFVKNTGIDLRTIQKEALFRIINSSFSVNASICGSGKTLTTLLHTFFFHASGRKTLTIIASPVSCMSEYRKEIQTYRGYFEDLSIEEIYGNSVKEMTERLENATSDILVISLNSIEKMVEAIQEKVSAFDGEFIFVIEEGHYVKEVNSGRSKGAQMLAPLANRVVVNTATPMPKGPVDIRGILSLVGIPQPLEAYSSGIPKGDFETLRGVTFVSDEVDIPYAPLKTEHMEYHNLEELHEKMSEVIRKEILNGKKVVVFCSTNKGLSDVWNSFPDVKKTVLSGSFFVDDCSDTYLKTGRSFDHQQKAIHQFNNDERCMLLIANYKVGSTGVNLQHSGARTAFFFEISNNGADFFQARYRIRRPYVFPENGFTYYFARNSDTKKRKTEERQFAKLANQQVMLSEIKKMTRGAS